MQGLPEFDFHPAGSCCRRRRPQPASGIAPPPNY